MNLLPGDIRGWGNYFSKGNVRVLFKRLDEWIRMRLHAYMEKKRAHINQNKRIPTALLKQLGLNSLLMKVS